MKKNSIIILAILLALSLLTGCGQSAGGSETSAAESAQSIEAIESAEATGDISAEEDSKSAVVEPNQGETGLDALLEQVAEREVAKSYQQYLPDQTFARAEVFGTDKEGTESTAYVYLTTAEYVVLKEKAYEMSGSSGEAIIRYEDTNQGPKLTEVIWSEDGAGHDDWVKENFPKAYLDQLTSYLKADGSTKLADEIAGKAEKAMGVPVEKENLLTVDLEKGTYEITKSIETGDSSGEDYEFEIQTIEKGKLEEQTQ